MILTIPTDFGYDLFMTQTAVTAGEAVTAGQVIGYVGSTGDSTGNHLHFEVMQNGVRMNPLELVFAQ
jgi:murein DD-endopeptidase MepM/ murein hydrolase activator NlpD